MTVTAIRQLSGWSFADTESDHGLWFNFSVVRGLRALGDGPLPEGAQTRTGRSIAAGAAEHLDRHGLAQREPDSVRWQLTAYGRAHLDAIHQAEGGDQ